MARNWLFQRSIALCLELSSCPLRETRVKAPVAPNMIKAVMRDRGIPVRLPDQKTA